MPIYKSLKDLSKRQYDFLLSLFYRNTNFYLEVRWLMARQSPEVKKEIADKYSTLFTVQNQKLSWSEGFHLFFLEPEGRGVAERHFQKLAAEEKNEDFFNFIFNHVRESLTANFVDEIEIQNFHRVMNAWAHMEVAEIRQSRQSIHKKSQLKERVYLSDLTDQLALISEKTFAETMLNKVWRDVQWSELSVVVNKEIHDAKVNEMEEKSKIQYKEYSKEQIPVIMITFFLIAVIAAVVYGIVEGNIAFAGIATFSLPISVIAFGKVCKRTLSHNDESLARLDEEIKDDCEFLKRGVQIRPKEYMDIYGVEHEYQAINVEMRPESKQHQVTKEQPTPQSAAPVLDYMPIEQPTRVRPESKYKHQAAAPRHPFVSTKAKILQALKKSYPRDFKEDQVKVIAKGLYGVMDDEALKKQGVMDLHLNAIKNSMENSADRYFLAKNNLGKNGIKTANDQHSSYTCPVTGNRNVSIVSYVKNKFSKWRVDGRGYETEDGKKVIVFNRATQKQ